ncbi:MAG: type II toxin-antitoxin system prevent-host-death family antitoxin [Planctomycetes bacterium]|nr:type II toxin-antitoxin system prevent-host-death family antitoxin [Planctomycetota bacterium]
MKDIYFGVREFQAQIGRALRAVRDGKRVIITSRDREVAVVTRATAKTPKKSALDRKLDKLAAEGFLHRGNGKRIREEDLPTFHLDGVIEELRRQRDRR